MKAMWHLINVEVSKPVKGERKIELMSGTKIISDQQTVADMLNTFFVEISDDLLSQNNKNTQLQKQRINCCPSTIFLHPVTEYEIECVTNSLKGVLSAGYDEVPEFLVKKIYKLCKKTTSSYF
jgi:hypothetical protein